MTEESGKEQENFSQTPENESQDAAQKHSLSDQTSPSPSHNKNLKEDKIEDLKDDSSLKQTTTTNEDKGEKISSQEEALPPSSNAINTCSLEKSVDFYKQATLPDVEEISTDSLPLENPDTIGPYKIESLLDRGGMSLLYLGVDPKSKEPITIKVLLPKYVSHPEMKERFLKEAEIISLTDHPNIVKLYGHGEWEQGLYIAMEFIQGVSLRQFILQNAMSLQRSLELILQVSYALCHLHTHGVIHRDLKPENIILTETGGIKVIDFGIAQLRSESQERITQKKRMMGTPIYMSPEQKETPLKVSYSADIYSLGIITYELILGKLSHGVIHLNLMPRGLGKILKKALQAKAKDRYQDIVDFITDLSNYMKSPKIQKEKKGQDHIHDLSERLQETQKQLLSKLPDWNKLTLAVVNHNTLNISGVYYDFFALKEGKFAIILGECSAKGIEGVIFTAVLRGMARVLVQQISHPIQCIEALNQAVAQDPLDQIFVFSYLLLDPPANQMRYVSCGYGNLWHTPLGATSPKKVVSDNIALGISKDVNFLDVTQNWKAGDHLLINTYGALLSENKKSKGLNEKVFMQALQESHHLSAQPQLESILRKVKKSSTSQKILEERPVTLISIQRKS